MPQNVYTRPPFYSWEKFCMYTRQPTRSGLSALDIPWQVSTFWQFYNNNNSRYRRGCTKPLKFVSKEGINDILTFDRQGSDPNSRNPNTGRTALDMACILDREDMVKELLEKGAEGDLATNRGIHLRQIQGGGVWERDKGCWLSIYHTFLWNISTWSLVVKKISGCMMFVLSGLICSKVLFYEYEYKYRKRYSSTSTPTL